MMTFEEVCNREPRLRDLEREVRAFVVGRERGEGVMELAWYGRGGFKGRMVALMPWADPSEYNAAYRHLYYLLTGCRLRL